MNVFVMLPARKRASAPIGTALSRSARPRASARVASPSRTTTSAPGAPSSISRSSSGPRLSGDGPFRAAAHTIPETPATNTIAAATIGHRRGPRRPAPPVSWSPSVVRAYSRPLYAVYRVQQRDSALLAAPSASTTTAEGLTRSAELGQRGVQLRQLCLQLLRADEVGPLELTTQPPLVHAKQQLLAHALVDPVAVGARAELGA